MRRTKMKRCERCGGEAEYTKTCSLEHKNGDKETKHYYYCEECALSEYEIETVTFACAHCGACVGIEHFEDTDGNYYCCADCALSHFGLNMLEDDDEEEG
jgi:hypothetical protein